MNRTSLLQERVTPKKNRLYCKNDLKKNTNDLLCGLKALNAILSHVKKDTVNLSVTDSAMQMAKREEQLLYDKSVSKISDLYHHPDDFYAPNVIINLIKKHTCLEGKDYTKKD